MEKLNLGVVLGGISTEHEVSIASANSVLENLNKEKYNIHPIYINKEGVWQQYETKQEISNIVEYVKTLDVIFPVLHGLYGEDGTIQGLFELLKVPYVGCKVLGSSIAMDKAYTKIIFEKANIKQAKYIYIRRLELDKYVYIDKNFNEIKHDLDEICDIIQNKVGFPNFVKPSNSGSSVGINKAKNHSELKRYIEYASQFDKKILIEEGIEDAKEVEVSILGNEEVKSSVVGEIIPAEEFYSYDAKYNNSSSRTIVPASLPEETSKKIRETAVKAFKAIDGKGLSRVDFFVKNRTNEIYINEINTMPGFTNISMYPKLWASSGIEYSELLDELIKLSLEK